METRSKLKLLLRKWPRGAVWTAQYLHSLGYSYDLISKYRQSDWIRPVGHGAYYRSDDPTPAVEAGVATLQMQLGLRVHVGGRGALEFYSATNQVPAAHTCFLFGAPGVRLPKWFTNFSWSSPFYFQTSSLFAARSELGITWVSNHSVTPVVFPCSIPERAILERFLSATDSNSLDIPEKDLQHVSGHLRPEVLQQLLEQCTSIRVKRIFLYASSLWSYEWRDKLDLSRINLGSGPRQFAKGGVFDRRFLLTVPPPVNLEDVP